MPPSSTVPLLIDRQSDLDLVCEMIERCDELAVDTEFVRINTFFPKLGLVQISTGDAAVCVDPLADLALEPLWKLLFDPGRLLILHAAKQDLEVLMLNAQQLPASLMDTQIEAGLLGYPAQVGYAGLAKELLDVNLSKSQTRTDWSRRPLTDAQVRYAAADVDHLLEMHERMRKRLTELRRYSWAEEDAAELSDAAQYQQAPGEAWRRLKRVVYLPSIQQNRARALAEWREHAAIRADRPRQWILSDQALLQMTERGPTQIGELEAYPDLPPAVVRKRGAELLELIARADQAVAAGRIHIEQRERSVDENSDQVKRLLKIVRGHSERLNIPAEVLASRREINAIVGGGRDSRPVRGWRLEVFGNELLAALGA